MTIAPTETPQEERTRLRRVATAAIVGTTVEWFDFYLYATMASVVFAKVFFPSGNSELATLQAFATFAIGFVARPVGGIVFGRMGDRLGRKKTLVLTFSLMGTTTALIGFLPTYAQAGYLAPALLVVLRLLQGMGAGAEYAGAAVVSYEHARADRRGSQGAWPALGLNIGLVLSSLVIFLLSLNGDRFLIDGGWRIPFILSLVLVAIGLWVRRAMPESPEFERITEAGVRTRFRDVLRDHWKGLLVVFVVAVGYNAVSYIFKTFSVAYLAEFQGLKVSATSSAILIAGIVAVITVPVFGRLCDSFGSKKVILWGGLLSAVFAFPFLWFLETGQQWGAYAAIGVGTGVLAPMMFSAQGAFLSRQFPADARSTGVGTAREIGTAVAGGLAPLGALSMVVASPAHSTTGVGIVIALSGLLVLAAALFDQGRRLGPGKN